MRHSYFQRAVVILLGIFCYAATSFAQATASPAFQIVESVPSGTSYGEPGVPRTSDVWLSMVRNAQHPIDIAAFYFSEHKPSALTPVLDALAERAQHGVAVRILVDQSFLKSDHDVVDHLKTVPGIEVRILPVTALTGGVLHAKYMVVDAKAFSLVARTGIGEHSNISARSGPGSPTGPSPGQ